MEKSSVQTTACCCLRRAPRASVISRLHCFWTIGANLPSGWGSLCRGGSIVWLSMASPLREPPLDGDKWGDNALYLNSGSLYWHDCLSDILQQWNMSILQLHDELVDFNTPNVTPASISYSQCPWERIALQLMKTHVFCISTETRFRATALPNTRMQCN